MARMLKNERNKAGEVNKYNARKEWEGENANPEQFVSANDSLAYVKPKKYAAFDKSSGEEEVVEKQEEEVGNKAEVEEQDQKYKKVDYKKRYDDLKRHYDKKVNEYKKELEKAKAGPSYTPPKSLEDLEEWKQTNPDLYAVVESVSHFQAADKVKSMEEELQQVREKLMYEEARAAYAELKALVPDFESIRQSEDFHAWVEEQPEQIQQWVYENRTDAKLAAKAINLYKADRDMLGSSKKEAQPPRTPDAAKAVSFSSRKEEPSRKEKIWKASEIRSLHWKEFEKYQAEIDKAFAEGRVVND